MIIGQAIGDQTDYSPVSVGYDIPYTLPLIAGDVDLSYGLYMVGDSVSMGAQTALSGRAKRLGYNLNQNTVVFQVTAYGDPLSATGTQYLVPVYLPEPVPVGYSVVCPVGFFTRIERGFVFGSPVDAVVPVGRQVALSYALVDGGQVYVPPVDVPVVPPVDPEEPVDPDTPMKPVWQIYPTIDNDPANIRFIYDEDDV